MNHPVNLLIVDDDRLVLNTLAQGLRQEGFEVLAAASAQDGLKHLENTKPDLALLDMRMPGMDGIELAKILRDEQNVPFVFLSAYSDEDTVNEAARHGALGYLVKPLDVSQIAPSLHAALARATELKKLRDTETQLKIALDQGRETSMAIGVLIERLHLDRQSGFEVLREHARSQRRKMAEVANEVLIAAEMLNMPHRSPSAEKHKPQRRDDVVLRPPS